MDPAALIPTPDPIPAPWWIFEALEQLAFVAHILMINVVVGGGLLLFWSRIRGAGDTMPTTLAGPSIRKIPGTLALAINAGIVPLLCIQVVYGHLYYTSSILMASWWMWIIPLLIIAYYGIYIHANAKQGAATFMLGVALVIFLYIGFMFVNNMSLMLQPERWGAYFTHRDGSFLNLADSTVWPKYFHFLPAALASGGLFSALVWQIREKRGQEVAPVKIRSGLNVFAYATIVQILTGFWLLIALPEDIMFQYMGRNIFGTALLFLGILLVIGALVMAFRGKVTSTLYHLVGTVIVMALMRMVMKFAYLRDNFTQDSLALNPQYGVLALFLLIFVVGIGVLIWIIRTVVQADSRRAAQ